jgi:hypothetical protein
MRNKRRHALGSQGKPATTLKESLGMNVVYVRQEVRYLDLNLLFLFNRKLPPDSYVIGD